MITFFYKIVSFCNWLFYLSGYKNTSPFQTNLPLAMICKVNTENVTFFERSLIAVPFLCCFIISYIISYVIIVILLFIKLSFGIFSF